MNNKKFNIRVLERVLDVMYVIGCLLIIGLTVFLCLKPVDHAYCFPIIFLLAALLNLASAYSRLNRFSPNHGHSPRGVFYLVTGIILMLVALVSFASII